MRIRHDDADAAAAKIIGQRRTQCRVACHTAADAQRLGTRLLTGLEGLVRLHIHHRCLKARGEVGDVNGLTRGVFLVDVGDHGRFEAGKRELEVAAVHHRTRELDRLGIAACGIAADDRPAGITQAQCLGHLVKGLPHCIVFCRADDLVVAPVLDMHEHGMAAAYQQGDKRRLDVGCHVAVCVEMPLQVVDADKRQLRGKGKALGKGQSHYQRTHQTGTLGHRDGRKVAPRSARLLHGIHHRGNDGFGVLAACDLWHDAAKAAVEVDLACHLIGQDVALPVDHRSGRLVARTLYGKNQRLLGLAAGICCRTGAVSGAHGVADRIRRAIAVMQRQRAAHDHRIGTVMVVVRPHAHILKPDGMVERQSGLVVAAHLQGDGICRKGAGVGRHALEQTLRDTLTALVGVDAHVEDAQLAIDDLAARAAHEHAVLTRHPPAAVCAAYLVCKLAARPSVLGHGALLQLRHRIGIVDRHRMQEQPSNGAAIGNAACGHVVCYAQASALCLLCIRQARVNGQQKSRIPATQLFLIAQGSICLQQALSIRGPKLLRCQGKKLVVKQLCVFVQAIAQKRKRLTCLSPLGCNIGRFGNAVQIQAHHSVIAQVVAHGVDLLAHGVFYHAYASTHAAAPCVPRHGVKRRDAVDRAAQTAGHAFGGCDADAHARKRARAPADDDHIDIISSELRLGEHIARTGKQDLV